MPARGSTGPGVPPYPVTRADLVENILQKVRVQAWTREPQHPCHKFICLSDVGASHFMDLLRAWESLTASAWRWRRVVTSSTVTTLEFHRERVFG